MADEDNETLDVISFDESLSDVEKPPELPPGKYVGEIQDVQVKVSGAGNRYFSIAFKIPPAEIPANIQDQFEDGVQLYWNRQIVPDQKNRRAMFNLRKLLEACGLDSDIKEFDPNTLMGARAKLTVRMGKWQGENRAEIGAVDAAEAPKAAATARGKGRNR